MAEFNGENKNKNDHQDVPPKLNSGQGSQDDRTQKVMVVLLVVIGIAILSFGVWYIGKQLKNPFETNSSNLDNSNQLARTTNTIPIARSENLRDRDTDSDGLTDYDELYIFKTSPYLSDSDGDKMSDQIEVNQGTDPNCHIDKVCGRQVNNNSNINATSLTNSQSVDLNNLSADQLRILLRDAGVPQENLNEIEDEALLQMYNDVLQEEGYSGDVNSNTTSTDDGLGAISYDQLKELTPKEIRQLMIQNGVPEETLNTVDDETLLQIYSNSLEQSLEEIGYE